MQTTHRYYSNTISDCTTPTIEHGTVTAPTLIYGSTANYNCNPGYELNGLETRTCVAGGTWNGSDPACDPVGRYICSP